MNALLSEEQLASVKILTREVTRNPSLLEQPEYAFFKDFIATVRCNPLQIPLDTDECSCGAYLCLSNFDEGPNHSNVCNQLRTLRHELAKAKLQLSPETLNSAGTFPLDETIVHSEQKYMAALFDLGMRLFEIALTQPEPTNLFERCLACFIEFEGRGQGRSTGSMVSEIMSVTLLRLNRFQDLWAYIQFWGNSMNELSAEQRGQAQSGVFPYVTSMSLNDLSVLDVFAEISNDLQQEDGSYALYFLVILWIMKSKLLEEDEYLTTSLTSLHSATGHRLEEVSSVLDEIAQGTQEYRVRRTQSIDVLLEEIDQRNPSILPAYINPEPLLEENDELGLDYSENWIFPRCPREAYFVFMATKDEFAKLPQARRDLLKIFGESPLYHASPFDYEGQPAKRIRLVERCIDEVTV